MRARREVGLVKDGAWRTEIEEEVSPKREARENGRVRNKESEYYREEVTSTSHTGVAIPARENTQRTISIHRATFLKWKADIP